MSVRHIIDNEASTVAGYLKQNLSGADAFRFVSAYFTIYGYELLEQELNNVGDVRFLFGEPDSVESLDPGKREPKSFELTEQGLVPNHTLQQKHLAKRCAEWVGKDTVAVRSVSRSNFLHGKMYLTESSLGAAGVVGSSNFTKRGLGGSDRSNLEINLATGDGGHPDRVARMVRPSVEQRTANRGRQAAGAGRAAPPWQRLRPGGGVLQDALRAVPRRDRRPADRGRQHDRHRV